MRRRQRVVRLKMSREMITNEFRNESKNIVFVSFLSLTTVFLLVYYDDELVTRFRMSSAISDDPLFSFKLKADKEASVKVVFVDNHGKRWETSKKIKFKG